MNEDNSGVTRFLAGCWTLYLAAMPLHVFPSGYPQPTDLFLLAPLFVALAIVLRQPRIGVPPAFMVLGLFAALTLVVNLGWFVFFQQRGFLLASLFTVFNAAVFCLCVFIFDRAPDKARKWSLVALGISIALETLWTLSNDPLKSGRAIGSFSNPNQMAYWALTTLLCVLVLRQDKKFGLIDCAAFAGCGGLILLSLSKAGIAALAICVAVVAISPRVSTKARLWILGLMVLLPIALLAPPPESRFSLVERVVLRIQSIGYDADDTLDARGYTRLITHPEYLLFGAGEGAYDRFVPYGSALEIHSGFASTLFCYGLLGFVLFTAFIVLVFRGSPWHVWLLFTPIAFHSLTHQTFRFTMFWVFMGLVFAMTRARRRGILAP